MDENQQAMPPPQYADGSRVLCADGQTLGEVVATYREYLIVERGYFFPANYYVPFAAISEAGGGDIVLSLNGQDALAQGWHTPPEDPVVPEVQTPVPPKAEPVATTVAPVVPAKAAQAMEPVTTTTAAPTVAAPEEFDTESAKADKPSVPEQAPQEIAGALIDATTTAAPAIPVEELRCRRPWKSNRSSPMPLCRPPMSQKRQGRSPWPHPSSASRGAA